MPAVESGRIAVDFEYQFMLYRHWSLYEAMLHSPYVASKLLLWWAHGRQRLDELLAKMGFSLAQCKCVHPFPHPTSHPFRPSSTKDHPTHSLSIKAGQGRRATD